MSINVESMFEKYNADFVFSNEGDNAKVAGSGITEDIAKQAVVVLKQSLDAAECSSATVVEFYFSGKKFAFLLSADEVVGIVTGEDADVSGLMPVPAEPVEEAEEDKKGGKVVLKERKKIVVKGKEEKEEKKPEKKEEKKAEEKKTEEHHDYKLDDHTIENIKIVAAEYLEDFAEDIINNLIRETKIDKNALTQDNIDKFLKKLSKSASLIIGPTQAQEMAEKINEQITL